MIDKTGMWELRRSVLQHQKDNGLSNEEMADYWGVRTGHIRNILGHLGVKAAPSAPPQECEAVNPVLHSYIDPSGYVVTVYRPMYAEGFKRDHRVKPRK